MKDIFGVIKKEVQKTFFSSKTSHNWEHTERVLKLALHIARKEKANIFIVRIASLLHDIGRSKEDNSNGKINHAIYGAKIAGRILARYRINPDIIEKVIHCIKAHRFRGKIKPKTKEARCLFDADKLDSIGAVGIGRAFLFAGEVGAKLHNRDVNIKKTKPYTSEDTAYREYIVKLRHVRFRMLTKEGKRLAKSRAAFMKIFFRRFNNEVTGKI